MTQTKNNYSVYMHVFPNGKRYIGITSQKPEQRWRMNGKGYQQCPKMWNVINKYGWENIEHIVLYEGLSKEMAEKAEIRLISEYNTTINGYNVENGGNVIGTHSEETKRKIAEANRRRLISEKTKREHSEFMKGNQYNKGNHHTAEFKEWKSAQMREAYSEGRNPRCKRILMIKPNGSMEEFWSLRKAAEVAGVSPACMHKHITNNTILNGCRWGYKENA